MVSNWGRESAISPCACMFRDRRIQGLFVQTSCIVPAAATPPSWWRISRTPYERANGKNGLLQAWHASIRNSYRTGRLTFPCPQPTTKPTHTTCSIQVGYSIHLHISYGAARVRSPSRLPTSPPLQPLRRPLATRLLSVLCMLSIRMDPYSIKAPSFICPVGFP